MPARRTFGSQDLERRSGAVEDWTNLDPSISKRMSQDVNKSDRPTLADDVADVLLSRFRDPLTDFAREAWLPRSELLVQSYGRAWARTTYSLLEKYPEPNDMPIEQFPAYVQAITTEAPCSPAHPIFEFARERASKAQLTKILCAENLCDLHFVNLLSSIAPGLSGKPAAEVAENLWDEWGHGDASAFHRNVRLTMMHGIGLEVDAERLRARDYLPEEVEHFNAYALNGCIRAFNVRLIGMMYATEFLVPRQLAAVIDGWRRVGLSDAEMQYLLDHYVGDVEHAAGWADSVILPLLKQSPDLLVELRLGVLQHVDILGRLYDALYDECMQG